MSLHVCICACMCTCLLNLIWISGLNVGGKINPFLPIWFHTYPLQSEDNFNNVQLAIHIPIFFIHDISSCLTVRYDDSKWVTLYLILICTFSPVEILIILIATFFLFYFQELSYLLAWNMHVSVLLIFLRMGNLYAGSWKLLCRMTFWVLQFQLWH